MDKRLQLHYSLSSTLGSNNVYFQPPASTRMSYPAIVYSRSRVGTRYADNSAYSQSLAYDVTVIYKDPDSDLPIKISQLPLCRHDRHYVADNLYHDTFTLYY